MAETTEATQKDVQTKIDEIIYLTEYGDILYS